MSDKIKLGLFAIVVVALLFFSSKPGTFAPKLPPSVPPVVVPVVKVTAVTYVYEKDSHAIPSPVLAALNTLNRAGIVATLFEQDTTDGTGQTPEQYQVPLAAAKEAGLPVLVATGGGKVIRTVKNPTTEEQVLEAAK